MELRPWKHERWAGKGLEWSERVGWGAGEDLGRTTKNTGHESTLGKGQRGDWTLGGPSVGPSMTPQVLLSPTLGTLGPSSPISCAARPWLPPEGPWGAQQGSVTHLEVPPALSCAHPWGPQGHLVLDRGGTKVGRLEGSAGHRGGSQCLRHEWL